MNGTPKPPMAKKPAPPKGQVFSPAQLAPDLSAARAAENATHKWYWFGLLPSAPSAAITLGGFSFPQASAELVPSAGDSNTLRHRAMNGNIARMTREDLDQIGEALKRTIFRFRGRDKPRKLAEGQTWGLEDVFGGDEGEEAPPRGYPIKISREKDGGKVPYQPQPGDHAAADFVFLVPCENQDDPVQGNYYPNPVNVTGIEWPE